MLAVFALLAWLTSRQTLKQMELDSASQIGEIQRQISEQRQLIEEQIASQETLAREERAVNALARYMTALRNGQAAFPTFNANIIEVTSELSVSWTLWAHQVKHLDGVAYKAARTWHAGSLQYLSRISTLGSRVREGRGGKEEYERLCLDLSGHTSNWLEAVTGWQMSPAQRGATRESLEKQALIMSASSPKREPAQKANN